MMILLGVSSSKAADPPRIKDKDAGKIDWWLQPTHPDSLEDIPKAKGWTHLTHKDFKIAVLIGMDHGDGESYIPVSAYIYNEYFKEWRCFMTLETRGVTFLRAQIDHESENLEIIAAKHSPLEGTLISSFSLKAVGNDRFAADRRKKTEQGSAR